MWIFIDSMHCCDKIFLWFLPTNPVSYLLFALIPTI